MNTYYTNPDWYRIKYSLAAEYANWSMSEGERINLGLLAKADREVRELLDAASSSLDRRSAAPMDDELSKLLSRVVVPSALVLLAGVTLAAVQEGKEQNRDEETAPPGDVTSVRRNVAGGAWMDPRDIVRVVEGEPSLPVDVSYNLACFYSQLDKLDVAWGHLQTAFRNASPARERSLRQQALRDPVLQPLAREFRKQLNDPAKEEEDPEPVRSWI